MSASRVALDARLTRQMSVGMQAYVRELVARMPSLAPDLEFVIFGNRPLDVVSPNARLVQVSPFSATNGGVGEQFAYPRQLLASGADLVHYMSVYAPRQSSLPHLYTIHDLIHLRFPQYFSWKVPPYYRLVVGPVARTAREIITDANATVMDICELLGVARERVRVIALGVSDGFVLDEREQTRRAAQARNHFSLDRPYFLYAGNHRPHKNVGTLFRAWRDFVDQACDLVMTEEAAPDVTAQEPSRSGGQVRLVGHVASDELAGLYAGCIASVQPSLYEGFGLSVLEAMSCGAPAIVAQTPALLEVGGDAVASFVPTDAQALATQMTALLADNGKADQLRAAGRLRARSYTWDATARATIDAYREALQR